MLQGKLSKPAVVCICLFVWLPACLAAWLPACLPACFVSVLTVGDQVHLKPDVPAAKYLSVCPYHAAYDMSCLRAGSNDPSALCCGHVPGGGCHKPSVDAA